MIMNTPNPLPLLLNVNSLTLEYQLYEIIIQRSKACATFLKKSLRRKAADNLENLENLENPENFGWSIANFESDRSCREY